MDKKQALVVGIGEILWDVFEDRKTLGGAPANFAYHASRLGAEGVAVSAIGNDALGDAVLDALSGKALKTQFQRVSQATGTVRITLDEKGVARYEFPSDVAWDNLEFTDALKHLAQRTDAVCFGTLAQRAPRTRATIRAFVNAMPESSRRIFDINLRQNFYSENLIRESLAFADMLKLNDDELRVLAPFFGFSGTENFESLREGFFEEIFTEFPRLKTLALTCGAHGSYAATRDGKRSFVPSDPATCVVDTVGAGDAFTATFVLEILAGKSLPEAHQRAAQVAEWVCSRAGAMPEN